MVMPSNNSSGIVHYWAGRYQGRVGHLYSPGGAAGPWDWMPYALDNGAYGCYLRGQDFNFDAFYEHIEMYAFDDHKPIFVVVPDKVGSTPETKQWWDEHSQKVKSMGFKTAFAVQNGMTQDDVPRDADQVFVGGITQWKWDNAHVFASRFPTHVGRVNSPEKLDYCEQIGVLSCDGTGWFRGNQVQFNGLKAFVEKTR